jgi:putative transcriptional regulator
MNLQHHFLLAMPGLAADYFANSLTYICEHNEEGAMGIMVNRPSDMSLVELLSQLGLRANRDWVATKVFEGGPVATERGLVLHRGEKKYTSSAELGEGLYLSTAIEVLDAIAEGDGPEQFIVALGYSGWGAGQLESEVANNVWLTAAADVDVLFHPDADEKLNKAAQTLGIDLRLIAAKPGHA